LIMHSFPLLSIQNRVTGRDRPATSFGLTLTLLITLCLGLSSCGAYTHEAAGLRRIQMLPGGQAGQYRSLAGKTSLRFLVFGDFGSGSKAQYDLAQQMKAQCDAAGGCDFALVAGDNIYGSGAQKTSDLQEKFEMPYQSLGSLDFWLVPGNHDWSSEGSVQREIDHSLTSQRWRMPFNYFAVPGLPPWVHIYGFDTTIIEKADNGSSASLNLNRDLQLQGARQELCGKQGWRLAFGHHAVYSGGEHGAPSGLRYAAKRLIRLEKSKSKPGILEEQQKVLEPFFRDCDVQVYFAGHDHNQELIAAKDFVQVVQGAAGAELRDVKNTSDPAENRESKVRSSQYGFAIVDLTPQNMRIRFFECGEKNVAACKSQDVASLQP